MKRPIVTSSNVYLRKGTGTDSILMSRLRAKRLLSNSLTKFPLDCFRHPLRRAKFESVVRENRGKFLNVALRLETRNSPREKRLGKSLEMYILVKTKLYTPVLSEFKFKISILTPIHSTMWTYYSDRMAKYNKYLSLC